MLFTIWVSVDWVEYINLINDWKKSLRSNIFYSRKSFQSHFFSRSLLPLIVTSYLYTSTTESDAGILADVTARHTIIDAEMAAIATAAAAAAKWC